MLNARIGRLAGGFGLMSSKKFYFSLRRMWCAFPFRVLSFALASAVRRLLRLYGQRLDVIELKARGRASGDGPTRRFVFREDAR
jgi:hypothetical protein